jgi:signal transduction histidine kinase
MPAELDQKLGSYMAHELRAPLIAVISALDILKARLSGGLGPRDAQMLEVAVRNSRRLDGLISDILDFEKARSGKLNMRPEALRPEALVDEAFESLQAWALTRGIKFARERAQEPLPSVFADRRRTVQVLVNLLSNAIKFSPAGGRVSVRAEPGRRQDRGLVAFVVKDSGPGIARQDLERIFDCFEQSALGAKASQGTGLGLTLAKIMVERQGGRIWAESWKGLGATFLFTLPQASGDPASLPGRRRSPLATALFSE